MPIFSLTEIEKTVQQIVRLFRPRRVILFGSYAFGDPSPDSDVDLLVEMETSLRSVEQAVEIRRSVQFPFPTDLIVRTPAQIAERLKMGDPFIKEILSQGKVLYEAPDAGVDQ